MARPNKATAFLNGVRRRKGGGVRVEVDGHPVILRPLSTRELIDLRKWHAENKDQDEVNVEFAGRLVAASVVDEDGSAILSPEDVTELDPVFLKGLVGEIEKLNGVDDPKA